MQNRPTLNAILFAGPDFLRDAIAQEYRIRESIDKFIPPMVLSILPTKTAPEPEIRRDSMGVLHTIKEIPYFAPAKRRTSPGYEDPREHNNRQANRAAADRSARAKKKATARMKKMARRRG